MKGSKATTEESISSQNERNMKNRNVQSSAIYGLGIIGSAVYYIHQAATFWSVVAGILKAAVWPAFLVYHLMLFLKM